MSDSKTNKEKLGDVAQKAEQIGNKLKTAGGLLTTFAALLDLFTKKD
jgi:hypothetical protein